MPECFYNDDVAELLKDQQRQELLDLIWSYTLALEQYVIKLRSQVNALQEQHGLQPRYPELESDFRIRYFRDLPAYQEFAAWLDADETDLVLPD